MSNRYTRHDSIQGVQIHISYTKQTNTLNEFCGETIPGITVHQTTTINEWQGKRTSNDSLTLHQPKIEI